jgi:tetratricopeptide (TPR) repeat protein
MQPDLQRLRSEASAGRLSRHSLLEEVERHLERTPDEPLEGALEVILEELHRSPGDPHVLRLLARLYERNGDTEGARSVLALSASAGAEAHEDVGSSVEDRLTVARALLESGQGEEAEALVREALASEPNSFSALNLLAKLCHIKGRLTETIHLWHRLHFLSPTREGALAQLGLLHRLAQDEELLRQHFVPVGQDAYARKHPVQMELERAFARFRERDFRGALAACEAIASNHRNKTPALYKLAVLQKAWFQERTDDLPGARETLVKLGREQGFETDLDRLGFLARVCERVGTPDALKQALHIYEHLNVQHGKLSSLPKVAALSRASGDLPSAERYEREFQRRFSRRMQKPSPSDVVRALALEYVPLSSLSPRSVEPEDHAAVEREIRLVPTVAGRQRRRALFAYLQGDHSTSRRKLERLTRSRWATAKDFAYLGDVLAAEGELALSHTAYIEAAGRAGTASPALWRRVLSGLEHGQDPSGLQVLLRDSEFMLRNRDRLLAAARAAHGEARNWRDLAAFERCAGLEAEASAHEAKANSLARAHASECDVGRVRVAAVYTLDGKPKGLIHELVAGRRRVSRGTGGHLAPDGLLGNFTPDFRELAVSVLATTRDFVRGHWPHLGADADDYVYTLKIAKEDEPSSGNSAGLPLAIAFLSVMTGRELPKTIAFSGAVVCDSRLEVVLRRVGDALQKVKGAYHCDLSAILLPEENRQDVERGDVVPLPIARSIARYARTLAEAVEVVWGLEAWEW